MRATVALLSVWLAAPATGDEGEHHLRAGAAHFRAGRYEEAVVEFKVAAALGAGHECPWYIAAALTRAGRNLDALEAFESAQRVAPESADALFLYYRGIACSDTQLVVCAAESFERASKVSGPKISEQARRLSVEARVLLSAAPPRAAIDALLTRAAEQTQRARPTLALLFSREAAALASLRADRWREAEAGRRDAAVDAGSARP